MSEFSLTLVLQIKTSKIINDMAKINIKSEKITSFGEIFDKEISQYAFITLRRLKQHLA